MLDPVTAARLAELRDMALSRGMVQHAAIISNMLGPQAKIAPVFETGTRMRRVAHEIVEALESLDDLPRARVCLQNALEALKAL